MIGMININSEYSKKVIEQVLKQKNKLEDESKSKTVEL
jgi:hypothetical protein